MTARLHRSVAGVNPRMPLILTRSTTKVATTCTLKNTWYGLDVGTLVADTGPSPDMLGTDIAGADHKIEPRFPTGVLAALVRVYAYSAACGTSHTSAEDFVIGLFDVQDGAPGAGGVCLWSQVLEDCPATETADTLEVDVVVPVDHAADLRFYIKNTSAAGHDFEWDPLKVAFIPVA